MEWSEDRELGVGMEGNGGTVGNRVGGNGIVRLVALDDHQSCKAG